MLAEGFFTVPNYLTSLCISDVLIVPILYTVNDASQLMPSSLLPVEGITSVLLD